MEYFAIRSGELPYQVRHMFLPPVLPQIAEDSPPEASLVKTAYEALIQFGALYDGPETAETRQIDCCIQALRHIAGVGSVVCANVLGQQMVGLKDDGMCYEHSYPLCYYDRR